MGVSKSGLYSKVVFISRGQNGQTIPRWHLIELQFLIFVSHFHNFLTFSHISFTDGDWVSFIILGTVQQMNIANGLCF